MEVELVLRAIYSLNPGREVGDAFIAHVKATGQPETFPTISTTPPADDGEIAVLAYPVEVERGRRPERDMAPCPICSPHSPKWLRHGTLVWCASTSAIYAIGPKCSTDSEWTRKLTVAQNVFQQQENERRNAADLAHAVELAEARIAWIDAALPAVRRVDQIQNDLGRKLPTLRATLGRMAKGGLPITVDIGGGATQTIGMVKGGGFLRSNWREAAKLGEARSALVSLRADCGDADPAGWCAALAPRACLEKLSAAKNAVTAAERASARTAEAVDFLGDETAQTLTAWANSPASPHDLRFTRAGRTVSLSVGDKTWRVDQVLNRLPPFPA